MRIYLVYSQSPKILHSGIRKIYVIFFSPGGIRWSEFWEVILDNFGELLLVVFLEIVLGTSFGVISGIRFGE